MLTTTYLMNLMLSMVLYGKSSFELLYKPKLEFNHLRNFGCLAHGVVVERHEKFEARVVPSTFLGHSSTQ